MSFPEENILELRMRVNGLPTLLSRDVNIFPNALKAASCLK